MNNYQSSDLSRVKNIKKELDLNQDSQLNNHYNAMSYSQNTQGNPSSSKQLLHLTSAVIQQNQQMKIQLKQTIDKLELFVQDTDRITKNIVNSLETKYQEYQSIGDGASNFAKKQDLLREIKDYTDRSVQNVEILRRSVCEYQESLIKINRFKVPDLKLAKGVSCQADILSESFDPQFGGFTNLIDQVNVNLMGLQYKDQPFTELIRLNVTEDNKLYIEPLKQLQRRVNVLIYHENRIICDDHIFQYDEEEEKFNFLQDLGEKNITGGVPLSDQIIVFGHANNGRLSIWRWNEVKYIKIVKSYLGWGQDQDYQVTMLRRDPFSELVNQIYAVFGCNTLAKLILNGRCLKDSKKETVLRKSFMLVDYKIVSQKLIIILYTHQLCLQDPVSRIKIANIKFNCEQTCLLAPPNFDLNLLPVVITKGHDNTYFITDMMRRGFEGELPLMIQQLQIIGPIEGVRDDKLVVLANDKKQGGRLPMPLPLPSNPSNNSIISLLEQYQRAADQILQEHVRNQSNMSNYDYDDQDLNPQQAACAMLLQKIQDTILKKDKMQELRDRFNKKLDEFIKGLEVQQGYLINRLEDLAKHRDEKALQIRSMKEEYGMNRAIDHEFNVLQEIEENFKTFLDIHLPNTDRMIQIIDNYNDSIEALNHVKIPRDIFSREVFCNVQQIAQLDHNAPTYDTIYEPNIILINENTFALRQKTSSYTDIYTIESQPSQNKELKHVKSLKQRVCFMLMHEDRLICDSFVYSLKKDEAFKVLQTLDDLEPICGCYITESIIVLGHAVKSKVSIWQWRGFQYHKLQCGATMRGLNTQNSAINIIKQDPFEQMNQAVIIGCGDWHIYRVKIDGQNVVNSEKKKISKRQKKVLDFFVL
eukprot:403337701